MLEKAIYAFGYLFEWLDEISLEDLPTVSCARLILDRLDEIVTRDEAERLNLRSIEKSLGKLNRELWCIKTKLSKELSAKERIALGELYNDTLSELLEIEKKLRAELYSREPSST